MGFRLILLMGMGLGAMYMMHLLAQDYNKIRRPVAAAARALGAASGHLGGLAARAKRQSPEQHSHQLNWQKRLRDDHYTPLEPRLQQPQIKLPESNSSLHQPTVAGIDWKLIMSRDPFSCLQSLICQMLSGLRLNGDDDDITREASQLMDYIERTLSVAPAQISRAFSRGLAYRGRTQRCFDEYPLCWYSARTMLRMLMWFSDNNGGGSNTNDGESNALP